MWIAGEQVKIVLVHFEIGALKQYAKRVRDKKVADKGKMDWHYKAPTSSFFSNGYYPIDRGLFQFMF